MTNRSHQDTKAQRKDQEISLCPGVLVGSFVRCSNRSAAPPMTKLRRVYVTLD